MIIDFNEDSDAYNQKINICWYYSPNATNDLYVIKNYNDTFTKLSRDYYYQESYSYNLGANIIKCNLYIRKAQINVE